MQLNTYSNKTTPTHQRISEKIGIPKVHTFWLP